MAQLDPRAPFVPARVTFADTASVTVRVADRAVAALLSPRARAFEACRLLRAKVKALASQRPLQCFGVVSATPREGTTTVALGLANALAQEGHRVLVIEATLREPSLERILAVPPAPGLREFLDSPGDMRVPLRRLEPWGIFLLSTGKSHPQPGEKLGSPQMATLLAAARTSFDYTIVDCPPLDPTADSVVLQDLLDGMLLVVRARHASRDAIRRASSHLKPDQIRGLVFNDRTDVLPRWLLRRPPTP